MTASPASTIDGLLPDIVEDAIEGGRDLFQGFADAVQDWTGIPTGDLVREIVDIIEQAGPIVLAEARDYALQKLKDPRFWATLGASIAACIPTAGATCVAQGTQLAVELSIRLAARGAAYGATRAIEGDDAAKAARNRTHVDRLTDRDVDELARRLSVESGAFNKLATEQHNKITAHPEWRRIMGPVEAREQARQDNARRQAEVRDWFEAGRAKIAAVGTFWGEGDKHYPLEEYVLRRQAGDGPSKAYYNSVPAAVKTVAREAVRRRFPAIAPLPATVRRLAAVFVEKGGMLDPEAGISAVSASLSAVQTAPRASAQVRAVVAEAAKNVGATPAKQAVRPEVDLVGHGDGRLRAQAKAFSPSGAAPDDKSTPPRAEHPPSAAPLGGAGGVLILLGVGAAAIAIGGRR